MFCFGFEDVCGPDIDIMASFTCITSPGLETSLGSMIDPVSKKAWVGSGLHLASQDTSLRRKKKETLIPFSSRLLLQHKARHLCSTLKSGNMHAQGQGAVRTNDREHCLVPGPDMGNSSVLIPQALGGLHVCAVTGYHTYLSFMETRHKARCVERKEKP